MALILKWTKRAQNSFDKILLYLEKKFGEKTKRAFIQKTFTIIENLQEYPELGTVEIKEREIQGFLIYSFSNFWRGV